jgi:predicted nucleotidyltransferase
MGHNVINAMTGKEIRAFVEELARRFAPERIILFGSHAAGDASAGSDVDLFVVINTPLSPITQEVLIRKEIPRRFPLDLIVMKPRQLERRIKLGDILVRSVFSKGKVFYEKDVRGMGPEGRG